MFRRVTKVDSLYERSGFRWRERFVERALRMRVEVVANQDYLPSLPVTSVEKGRHFDRPINLSALLADGGLTPSGKRLGQHEDACCPATFIFVVNATRMFFRGRNRLSNFFVKLNRLFAHAEHRIVSIVGFLVGIEDFFH